MKSKPKKKGVRTFLQKFYWINLILIFLLSVSMVNGQQQITVEGTVTDAETGDPLPGVNIVIQGTTQGTTTDMDGNYSIEAPTDGTLVFSFVGYQEQTLKVSGRKEINITLQQAVTELEEVVAIGYGTQRKSDLTGSVSSVSPNNFDGRNISSFEEGLQAQTPGVRVVQSSGQPGGRNLVRIRGQNSIMGGSDPLYVVDGVPVQSGSDGNTSILATINPEDIESIEVLKDASATAIYGARGSNGVVLITTKKGSSDQQIVSFETRFGISDVIKKIDLLKSQEFVEIANERAQNDGTTIPYQNIGEATETNTDWQDEIFRSALTQNYSISFSGGDEQTQYFASGSYLDQEGSIIGSGFSRGSFRLNLDQQVSNRLRFSSQMYVSRSEGERSNTETFGGVLRSALGAPPTDKPRDEEGNLVPWDVIYGHSFSPSAGDNPLIIAREELDRLTINRFLGNVRTHYDLYEDLFVEIMLGADKVVNEQDEYSTRLLRGVPDGDGSERRTENSSYVIESIFNYDRDFTQGQHRIDAVGGFTWESQETEFISASAEGFVTDDFQNNNLGAGERFSSPNSGISEWDIVSFLGRINYTALNRYLFTLSGRQDGSSRFGEGNKWGFFPSMAFAWRLTEEDFMDQIDIISNLKLRLSWGISGNQAISPYQSLQRFSPQDLVLGSSKRVGFAPANLGNPNLQWEETEQLNVGLDLGILSQRLRLGFDLYQKETRNLLAVVNLPPSSGYTSTIKNIGSMKNQGMELSLAFDAFRDIEDFAWNIDLNFSANNNEVSKLARGADIVAPEISFVGSAHILREGKPLSSFYGLKENGLTEDGLINYVDQNGDGNINNEDQVILGDPYPDFTFGFRNQISYKNISLSFFIQGNQGKQLWNANKYYIASSFFRGVNNIEAVKNRWTPEDPNQNASYPKATSNLNLRWSDRFVEDASYIRLKDIRLNYSIPVENLPAKSASVFISAQNYLTITDYSWYNPDVNAFPSGDLRRGVDNNTFPISKTLTFGINVDF